MLRLASALAGLLLANVVAEKPSLVPRTWNGKQYGCKCYFGDKCWPAPKEWDSLNKTVDGNLAVYIPPEASCHNFFNGTLGTVPTYDKGKCDALKVNYTNEKWVTDQDMMLLWTYWSNSSCLPTTEPSSSCTLGYYGVYLLKATEKSHIKAGVDFARRNNLRLVIRNTGHDFVGRSNGWGSLVINTHSFQDVKFVQRWDGPGYSGGAVTIGAGVQGRPLLKQAVAQSPPVAVVVGECPTVGVAGGYVQGGGHGPLTTELGFAADNALSFDVITADGEYVTANAKENSDLFWALRGGGPAAFGVIVSATFKTFPEARSAGATLYLNSTGIGTNATLLWEGIRIFHRHSNAFVDAGLYVLFTIAPLRLRVRPWVAFNKTAAQLDAILAPMKSELAKAGVPFENTPAREYPTLYDLYLDLFEDESGNNAPMLTSGWMFSRRDVAENNDGIIEAYKKAISPRADFVDKGYMVGHLWNAGYGVSKSAGSESAVNPRFRDASDLILYNLPLPNNVTATIAEKDDLQALMASLDQTMMKAGPNGAAYINEANPLFGNWQNHFWGKEVYSKLLNIRKKWDPEGVLYSPSTPGTEDWEVIEYGTRLCKRKT